MPVRNTAPPERALLDKNVFFIIFAKTWDSLFLFSINITPFATLFLKNILFKR